MLACFFLLGNLPPPRDFLVLQNNQLDFIYLESCPAGLRDLVVGLGSLQPDMSEAERARTIFDGLSITIGIEPTTALD